MKGLEEIIIKKTPVENFALRISHAEAQTRKSQTSWRDHEPCQKVDGSILYMVDHA